MKTKTDARKLDQATQAHLRKMVVQAVRDGMTRVEASRTYGVSLRAVGNRMKLAREGGLRALRQGKRGRRPGSGHLTHTQAVRIRKLIVERMPDQLALPFYLWTRESVAQLIERECGTKVSKWTVDKSGANLAALEALNAERSTPIKVRQNKYLNNIVKQDHRAVKRVIKPMMGFKACRYTEVHRSVRTRSGQKLMELGDVRL